VVAVGALTDDLQPAPFSNHGPWVDCSTVGVGVVSTFVTGTLPPEPDPAVPDFTFGPNSWAVWSGTSFSTPQIGGKVAAMCLATPGLQPRDALETLLAGLPEIPGYGRALRLLPGTPV
jgi:subtilisin family serine protease